MKVDKNIPNCLNCNNPFSEGDLYCSNCSQKRTNGLITVKDLFADFFSTLFNIDGKLFSTIKDIFIPGKLTTSFFAGHHEKYYKPLRMFIFFLVTFFAALSLTIFNPNNIIGGDNSVRDAFSNYKHKNKLKKEWESSLAKRRQQFTGKAEQVVIDSIAATIEREILAVQDSIYLFDPVEGLEDVSIFNFEIGEHKFATADLHLLENDFGKFAEKYEITTFMEKLGFQQSYKVSTDLIGTLKFILGNMTWMLIVLIPVIALILHLLYYKRGFFYVQHLTFLFHNHAFVFLSLSLITITSHFISETTFGGILFLTVLLSVLIFLFAAMKRFYGQGFFKTLLKYFIVLGSYLFISMMFFLITILISFAMYS